MDFLISFRITTIFRRQDPLKYKAVNKEQ